MDIRKIGIREALFVVLAVGAGTQLGIGRTSAADRKAAGGPERTATANASAEAARPSGGAADDSLTLRGGEPGTVFKDMTIEGEDRIRIEFDRPELKLELDPKTTRGLEWENALAVLDRSDSSAAPVNALLKTSAFERTSCLFRPWFARMSTGPVATFHPQVEKVERWTLVVADSRGNAVASFRGTGKAPREIAWDGRTAAGAPALPGLMYSYAFEAYDRAGNKRTIMGDGFQIGPYLLRGKSGMTMLFTGSELAEGASGGVPPILYETAGWLNQVESPTGTVRVDARAQSLDRAESLIDQVKAGISPMLLCDPARVQYLTSVEHDAPEVGTVVVTTGS